MLRIMWIVLILVISALNGCEKNQDLNTPRVFFNKNKVGISPDYAVVKWNDPEDHVVTVHGFMDDMKSCIIIADALNKDACKEIDGVNCLNPFSCQPLNY
jgi:hypothetical protein